MSFRIKLYTIDTRRRQRTLDKQLLVVRKVDDVYILITQFTNDAMYTATLHTHAGAYRVYTVVVAFYGYFGAFAWFA